jgi:TldD protein
MERPLRDLPEDAGAHLFFEEREDLVAEVSDGASPVVTHTRTCGLAASGQLDRRRFAYRSDPVFDDAERLTRCVLDDGLPDAGARGGEEARPEPSPAILGPDDPCRVARELADRAASLQPGCRAWARWIGFEQRVRIARPGRSVVTDVRKGARIRVEARLDRGGGVAVAVAEAVLPADGSANHARVIGLAHQVAQRVERRLEAVPTPPGDRTIVFAPGVGGVLIHEIIGHALEADAVLAGDSWLIRFKERLIPDDLTVLDDPRRGRAAWRVDDEGEEVRAAPLLRGGRVAGWLHDRRTARQSGRQTTGHARRTSYREPAQPRMGATFIAAGNLAPEEVLAGVEYGIYVRRMEAASVDPRRGRAVFQVTDSDLIRHGRFEQPLQPHLLRIDGPTALSRLTLVADDLRFDTCVGSCHRGGQPLAVSVGAPTTCIGLAGVTP